jgi:glycosyltransferase involved in cell wall biosynthesis
MFILNLVNSYIGKTGNIGMRTSHLITHLNHQKIANFSYSRGVVKSFSAGNKNMGIFGHIPRLLNSYRIYVNLNFNHRKYDIYLFECFFKISFKNVNYHKKIAHVWEISPKIIRYLKKNDWIIILDVPIAPTETGRNLVNKFKDKIVLHPHQFNSDLEIESFKLADYVIAPSNFVKDEISKLKIDINKIFVVPFGSNTHNSIPKEFNKNYKSDGIDFCFAGSINKRKGIEFLLEAWNNKVFENDRLHLCGRLYPEIKELLIKYDFKNVITPGFIDTSGYFKKCDVYIFPSLIEGSSKSIYEAMNCSLPCIVTHNSGSVITHSEDGFIVELADPEVLRDRMLEFKNDNSLIKKMGHSAFQNSRKYSWDNYAKNVVKIYKYLT